jgi:hypothetical protein
MARLVVPSQPEEVPEETHPATLPERGPWALMHNDFVWRVGRSRGRVCH